MNGMKDARHVRWPANRFYWAVLDASVLQGRARRRAAALGYLFEDVLPIPIDDVRATYRRLDGGRCLACAADRVDVEQALEAGALTLAPAALPPFIDEDIDPGSLNQLVGPCTPAAVRRLRRRRIVVVMLTVALSAAALLVGIERRIRADHSLAQRLEGQRRGLLAEVLGPDAWQQPQPPWIQLTAEQRRLRQTRRDVAPDLRPIDVSITLAAMLSRWPDPGLERPDGGGPDVGAGAIEIDSIVATPADVTVRGRVRDSAAAQRLHASIRTVPGWEPGPLQLAVMSDAVAITLQMNPRREEVNR